MTVQSRLSLIICGLFLTFTLSACVTDPIAWSPDGRYIAFIGGNDQKLWLWDSHTDETKKLTDKEISACRFLPNGREIVYAEESNNVADFYKIDIHTNHIDPLVQQAAPYFDTSGDGQYLFYLKETPDSNKVGLWQKDLTANKDVPLTGHPERDVQCVDADPAGERFLMTLDDGNIALWEKGQNGGPRILKHKDNALLVFPQWIDENRYIYFDAKKDDEEGALIVDSIDKSNPKTLCENAFYWDVPSITADGKSVIVTVMFDGNISQLVKVDLSSGKQTLVTDNVFGSSWAVLNPNRSKIAYISNALDNDNSNLLRVKDLRTGNEHIVWRDEEERMMAVSETLKGNGERSLAIKNYRNLLDRFPTSRFANQAWMRIMQLYLAPPSNDIDRAFDALNQMPESNVLAQAIFWNETDRTADDPADDWMARYGTPEAQQKFEFNTDLTRDLLGLSVKCSDKRMFFKIDYHSNRDLSGLTFQDTVVLLDYDTPGNGYRKISNMCEWDRGAERVIVLRHWYQNHQESQYDVAVLNELGENTTHFLASGFAPPNLPHFNVVEIPGDTGAIFLQTMKNKITDVLQFVGVDTENSKITVRNDSPRDTGSVVISISKDVLNLQSEKKVYVQVCTLKGGIEGFEKKERPLAVLLNDKQICDVADAFGPENTEKRILRDAKEGKPIVIKGCAAEIEF